MGPVELRTRIGGGYAVVVPRGELNIMDAKSTVAAPVTNGQRLITDLEGLDFIGLRG